MEPSRHLDTRLMTTVIRNASSTDVLSALPALLGMEPRNSVVLLGFRGNRTHATLRFDIPSTGVKRFAAAALGTFCKIPEVDGVVLVICTDAPFGSHHELLTVLIRRFEQAGFEVKGAFVVAADGWGSHLDPAVRPLSEIAAVEVPPSPARVPRADDLACRRMAAELERLHSLDADDEAFESLADLPFLVEGALDWDSSEVASRGPLLLFALQAPPARDLVMLQWAFGQELGDALWSADTRFGIEARKVYPDVDSQAAELMLGCGPHPSSTRILAAVALLETLISRSDETHRRAPLCMLAWLNWALGRGSAAGIHSHEVKEIDPSYSMGQLLDRLFSSGAMPEWLFSSPQIQPRF